MRKFSLPILMASAVLMFGAAVNAKYTGPTEGKTTSTVAEAKAMPDDAQVVLQGTITSATGDEMYVFTDGTDVINVEIDNDDIAALDIGPDDVVLIQGEIDRDGDIVEVDVDEIILAQ